jgi:hypothetical protein
VKKDSFQVGFLGKDILAVTETDYRKQLSAECRQAIIDTQRQQQQAEIARLSAEYLSRFPAFFRCQVCQHRIEIDRSSYATKGIVAVKIEPISANEGCTRLWKSEIHVDGIFEGLGVQARMPKGELVGARREINPLEDPLY